MDITSINSAIMQGNFTNAELTSIIDAVQFTKAQLGRATKRQLTIGTSVQFTSSRTGQVISGTVKKIAIKYVTVSTLQGQWKVPANMLEIA
jgi:hypothetical protein